MRILIIGLLIFISTTLSGQAYLTKSRIIILFFVLLGYCSFGQTVKTINALEDSYQTCLDKGVDMLGCSKQYYQQMDSMLNLVYKNLRKKMTSAQGLKLKTEQLKWLSKRDKYFKNVPLDTEEKALVLYQHSF